MLPDLGKDEGSAIGVGSGGMVWQGDLDTFISSPAGIAALSRSDDGIWWSPDLVSWTSAPKPTQASGADLSWAGGMFWLTTSDPPGLWRSTDATDWLELDLSGITPPDIPRLEWQGRVGTPLSSNGTTIVPILFGTQDTVSYLGLPDRFGTSYTALWESEAGTYGVGRWEDYHRGTLRFEEVPGGLRVIDVDDGTVYGELDGVGMDFIDGWAAQRNRRDPPLWSVRFGIVEGDGLTLVDSAMSPYAPTVLFGGEAGFVAYQQGLSDDLVKVWHSEDGASWTEVEPLGDDAGEPSAESFARFQTRADRVDVRNAETGEHWTSRDGLTWRVDENPIWRQDDYEHAGERQPWPPRLRRIEGDHVESAHTRLSSGFVRLLADHAPDYDEAAPFVSIHSLQVLVDGEVEGPLVDLAELGIEKADDGDVQLDAVSGNTVVLVTGDDTDPTKERGAWIFTFDDVPA